MGKLVVTEFISLDGVFEDPGGGDGTDFGGWTFRFARGDDGDRFKFDELMAADAQLLGRVTYEGFARAWPTMPDDSGFAAKMNAMPKVVVSTTLTQPDWNNTTVLASDVAAGVSDLKSRYAGDILIAGSGRLVRSLMPAGLIDEFRLMVFPIVLGKGRSLFAGVDRVASLRLLDTRSVGPDGVVLMTYAPAG